MKNKTTKTVQIATNELKKCKQGQEFKIDVVTYTKDKPIPPVPPIVVDSIPKPPKQLTLREMFAEFRKDVTEFRKDVIARLDGIDTRLGKQDEFNQYVRDVFERNNLK